MLLRKETHKIQLPGNGCKCKFDYDQSLTSVIVYSGSAR